MAEYIKLEELMKFPIRRNHYDKEHGNEDFICGIETVLEYAENLQTTDIVPEWISVKDRLPEDDSDVLAYSRNGEEGRIYPANYAKGVWFDCIFTTPATDTTTHWMPLPEPPKGE